MARLEMEAMAKSYGLTRKTHFLNVLDAAGISKTQKDKGEKRAEGGGYELVLEVPLFDFGKANVREAEQRYLEAANRLGQLGVNAASEAREAYGAYRATYAIARKYEGEVLPLHQTISAETELQYNAMQVDAFALLEAARDAGAREGRGHRGQAELLARLDRSQRGHAWRRHSRFRARRGDRGDEQQQRMQSRQGLSHEALTTKFSQRIGGARQASPPSAAAARPAPFRRRRPRTRPLMRPPVAPPSGQDYQPVVTLNGWTLPWRMNGEWKEFHLVAEPVVREIAPGMKANLWGYNGQTPGPTIEAVEGDKIRIFVTNKLPEKTTDPLARHAAAERHGRRRRADPAAHPGGQDLRLRVRS